MSELEFGVLVGLDWGDTSHDVALWDEQRQTLANERIEHTPAALRGWIEALRARIGAARIAVAIEQSRGAVFDALSGYAFVTLYPINPRSAARYREAFHPSYPKDDPTDAASLQRSTASTRSTSQIDEPTTAPVESTSAPIESTSGTVRLSLGVVGCTGGARRTRSSAIVTFVVSRPWISKRRVCG